MQCGQLVAVVVRGGFMDLVVCEEVEQRRGGERRAEFVLRGVDALTATSGATRLERREDDRRRVQARLMVVERVTDTDALPTRNPGEVGQPG